LSPTPSPIRRTAGNGQAIASGPRCSYSGC
jgi:hypothetical protein